MSNPNPQNKTNDNEITTEKSWWSDFTSTPVDDASSFDPDKFTQEVDKASWLDDLFGPK